MVCQDCKKNPASVPFIQILDGEKTVHHLCIECAEKRSGGSEGVTVTLSSLLAQNENEEIEVPSLTCSSCGLTFAEFKKTGQFGCDGCYLAFESELDRVFKRIHGVERQSDHGSVPNADLNRERIEILQGDLKKAVAEENFEEAAKLRDQIALIKERSGKDEKV